LLDVLFADAPEPPAAAAVGVAAKTSLVQEGELATGIVAAGASNVNTSVR
jgi:hypothetical protein